MNASRRFFGKILASAPLAAAAARHSPGDLVARQPPTPVRGYDFDSCSTVPADDPSYHEQMIRRLEQQAAGINDDPYAHLDAARHRQVASLAEHYGSLRSLSPSSRARITRERMDAANHRTWMDIGKARLAQLRKSGGLS